MTSPTKKFNWRDHLDVHPAADLFPAISEPELRWLGEDIKKNGLQQSIIIWTPEDKDNKREFLLDGRNRLDAASLVDILALDRDGRLSLLHPVDGDPRAIRISYKTGGDPYALAVSFNIHRRHLTLEQKRQLIEKLIKATPKKSNRQIAGQVKVSHPTVAKIRTEMESAGDVERVTTSIDTKGRKQPAKKPRSVSVKPTPSPTPAQRVENMIRAAGIADKKKHGELSIERVMNDVVAASYRLELIQLAIHSAPERHVPARGASVRASSGIA